ncbi:TonB-dependent receptor plug domain-containing protein [Ohtaekwangia sp.]|uniref:TonB-dependent receptor plug domain-containing protein n=1 Tax=Ohtaekwangia sp. TaxID=2066019 RepID=UPI002FDD391A
MKYLVVFLFLLGSILCASAQTPAPGDSLARYYDMSLEELRKVKASGVSSELEKFLNSLLSVASQKTLSTLESPGIVSLITEEEIKESGARDLIDVFRLIPGFDFAYDGNGKVGLGIRGNWVNEGKVLLLIDGVQMNDIFSATLSFGNHYSVNNISRIEVIRGPGSAIYGGFAELGVINIITKKGSELKGGYVTTTYGQTSSTYARRNVEFGIGNTVHGWDVSFTGIAGQGNMADRTAFFQSTNTTGGGPPGGTTPPITGGSGGGGTTGGGSSGSPADSTGTGTSQITGSYHNLVNNADANPFMLNLKATHKGFSFKTIFDNYGSTVHDEQDANGNSFITERKFSFLSEVKYAINVSRKLSVTPAITYIRQAPRTKSTIDSISYSRETGERVKGSILVNYNPSRKVNVTTGSEFFRDKAANKKDSIQTANGAVESFAYRNYAFFSQILLKHRLANVILGARYDHNSSFGSAFVPRVGLTRKIDRWHFKALYSGSFRAPTIQNIALGRQQDSTNVGVASSMRPEKTTIAELESGYQITRDMVITLNVYSSTIHHPIVYNSDLNIYYNGDNAATRGLELEGRYRKHWGYIHANYSFYTVKGLSKITTYTTRQYVSGDDFLPSGTEANSSVVLAFPAHKATLNAGMHVRRNITVSPTLIFYGKRYGYELTEVSEGSYQNNLVVKDPVWLANLYIYWKTPVHGLAGGAGVNNLFNTNYNYLSPYFTITSSYPSTSREFTLRLTYNFNL